MYIMPSLSFKLTSSQSFYLTAQSRVGMLLCICLTINKRFNKASINFLLIYFLNIFQRFNTNLKRFFHPEEIYLRFVKELIYCPTNTK